MRYLALASLIILAALAGCSDDDDNPTRPVTPEEQAAADSIAIYWSTAMVDSMEGMTDIFEGGVGPDDLHDLDMTEIEDGFQEALGYDPNNCIAHFGMAVMELASISTNEALWAFVDSLGSVELPLDLATGYRLPSPALPLRDGLMGHQFRILHEIPLAMVSLAHSKFDLSISYFQQLIHDEIFPYLVRSLDHLQKAEACSDFEIRGEYLDDAEQAHQFEIDLGEVYVLDASVRALRAALRMLIAYDIDIADEDGYGWLLDVSPDDPYEWDDYGIKEATSGGDTLLVLEYDEGAVADSVLTAHVRDLLSAGSSFLTLRSGPYSGRQQLQQAGIDLGGTLVKLTDAVEFIRAEDDTVAGGQDDDVIPLGWLTDLDEGIAGMSDAANFTSTWESIEDVLAWLDELRTGPYRFQETIVHEIWDEDLEDWVEVPMDIDVTLDLSVMLTNPVGDWKTKLPYHGWLEPEDWIVREAGEPWYTTTDPDSPYIVSILDEPLVFTGIGVIEHIVVDADMGPTMVMLDGSGGNAIGVGEFPYFPDYTFGGLFPGMDRPGWIELIEALEGPDR